MTHACFFSALPTRASRREAGRSLLNPRRGRLPKSGLGKRVGEARYVFVLTLYYQKKILDIKPASFLYQSL